MTVAGRRVFCHGPVQKLDLIAGTGAVRLGQVEKMEVLPSERRGSGVEG
jgi:hypothetical protein